MYLYLILALNVLVHAKLDAWQLVRDLIDDQPFIKNVCVNAGKAETMFTYCIGNMTMDTQMPIASSSKLVGAMPLYEAIMKSNGSVSLNDRLHKYLDFWTDDYADSRGRITLRDIVSFQDGYTNSGSPQCVNNGDKDPNMTLSDCVKQMYEEDHEHEAGTIWDYNEQHLQFIGAVLEKIYNKPIHEVLTDSLTRFNMSNSYWMNKGNPNLAADLVTTGRDYTEFLRRYYNYTFFTPDFGALIEGAYNVDPMVKPTEIGEVLMLFLGHYGHTMWYECSLAVTTIPNMRPECIQQSVHSCPGIFGYWPIIDRTEDYWFQVIDYGEAVLGCVDAQFFRLAVKPFIDLAMKEEKILPNITMPNFDQLLKQKEKWVQETTLLKSLEASFTNPMKEKGKWEF